MYTCPSCHAKTLRFLDKWLARETRPSRCSACGALCFVSSVRSSGILVTSILLFAGTGLLAVAASSATALAIGSLVVVALHALRWHRAPLEPIAGTHVVAGATSGALAAWSAAVLGLFQ